ncbi:MAG: glycosyltransferase [Flavobacteriales bacterium]|nr:glycosyltransferase [Flavobacteriales bacterium]MCB9191854.1 glycosyltransferase [Flavobacteriales bacterium]MCB9204725.1 glycosyltransferase [Flavobacteriales bacterium]
MDKHLHVISFDVPYPANYGGVIDVFYKVKALTQLGVKVHLHCFEYGRKEAPELEALCEEVYYYHRTTTRSYLFRRKPFIAVTRTSEELMQRLLKDNHPILFEGLHTCYHLSDERLENRFKIVRTHNIEHEYYANLAKVEKDFFKKYYFLNEVGKLQRFERTVCNAQLVAAISRPDADYLSARYRNVQHISAFHPNGKVEANLGKGKFCLYHGNLEVGENNEAALYLLKKVFNKIKVPLIIAGSKPSEELTELAAKMPHVELKSGLSTEEIHDLIREAQINVLPTFQATGIKLKLLAALYMGRHCVVNPYMVENTGLEPLCKVENTDKRFAKAIQELFEKEFTAGEVAKREEVLHARFCNVVNAEKLVGLIDWK